MLLWLVFSPAAAYQCLAIFACLRQLRKQRAGHKPQQPFQPAVSVLKPLRGLDPNTSEAYASQLAQNYPEFEVLFGASDAEDAAIPEVQKLMRRFPAERVRLIVGREAGLNGKVAVLKRLAKEARHPVWLVNDSDIKVTPEYLSQVVAPLADESVGVVTCLYRAKAHTRAAAWEALGIATDFMPSTLVAQLVGVREFGLGSTLAFRARDLEQVGGFAGFADFIADDYQLAKRITALGKRAFVSPYVVETSLGEASWKGIWRHQLRWARTIRTAKGGGYAGLPIAQAGVWTLVGLAAGAWIPAAILLALRWTSALLAARVLRSSGARRSFLLAPLWDLYSFALWLTSYAGRTVRWRDRVIELDRGGRIRAEAAETRVDG